MSTYHAAVTWTRGTQEFLRQRYSRGHTWTFDEGVSIRASASPHVVRAPWHETAAVDPEEALAAALASCHMLFFLSDASRNGHVVESYADTPEALMAKGPDGREWITRITLRPVVTFRDRAPSAEEFTRMHDEAHAACYIANSIKGEVVLEPVAHVG